MKRVYLEEDLTLIRKYFPGAKTVALRTPFDLTRREPRLPRLGASGFRGINNAPQSWAGDAVWTN